MYPGLQAQVRPNQPAIVMAQSGEVITYAELDRRSTRLAHVLRAHGLARLDHYAIFMENNARYIECCAAGERAGLLYTCVNSYLTPDELAYILNNCEARVLITSQARREVALAALRECPRITLCVVVDGPGDGAGAANLSEVTSGFLDTPIADETLGIAMLYSSGTTGRPKGILRPVPDEPPSHTLPVIDFLGKIYRHICLRALSQACSSSERLPVSRSTSLLQRFPRLVGERRLRTSADPFVIALARVAQVQIVRPRSWPSQPAISIVTPLVFCRSR